MKSLLAAEFDHFDPMAQHQWALVGRLNQDSELRCILVRPLPFRVGRQAGLSLTLSRQTVSAIHAEIFDQEGHLYIRDLRTTNGTYVNGEPIRGDHQLANADLIQFADVPFRLTRGPSESPSHTRREDLGDQALALVQFDQLFRANAIIPHIQPIVDLQSREPVGFEVLARSRLFGLETAKAMFDTAAQLGLCTELSQAIRLQAIEESSLLPVHPHLFFNTHPSEVSQSTLIQHCEILRKHAPTWPITLEIHEAAATNLDHMLRLRSELVDLNIRLAFDDFGSGQARLTELAAVKPDYLKFDRSLIQSIHASDEPRLTLVTSLVAMTKDIGVVPLAEGIQCEEEAIACTQLGFPLGQGFHFGRPSPIAARAGRDWGRLDSL